MSAWPEVKTAKVENRHELKLSGAEIAQRIANHGLDPNIFKLSTLNLLNISEAKLSEIPDAIGNLTNIQTLLFYRNEINIFNENISKLTKMKMLDLSGNCLKVIPPCLSMLKNLTNLNLSGNLIEELPSFTELTSLITVNLSHNRIIKFPEIGFAHLTHLSDLTLKDNLIEDIPGGLTALPALKNLDIGDNKVAIVPSDLAHIPKLKEINLRGNPLRDKKLQKIVDRSMSKQVLDYVKQHCPKAGIEENDDGKGKKGGKKSQQKKATNDDDESKSDSVDELSHVMQIMHLTDDVPNIKIDENVKVVRPHIVCCIVNNLHFTEDTFKKFIQMQTKLHDSVCDKRNAATIATHDFNKLAAGDLLYTAKPAAALKIRPLMRSKEFSGQQLFQQLQQEAENLRKEKKRNVYSGIHKFLYLLEGKPKYPCLIDSAENVISFPPITNSEISKMSQETTKMLIEVTSSASLPIAKKVMDTVLQETLMLGVSSKSNATDNVSTSNFNYLEVQQMKVVDLSGNLKSVYPSRADLVFEGDESTLKIHRG